MSESQELIEAVRELAAAIRESHKTNQELNETNREISSKLTAILEHLQRQSSYPLPQACEPVPIDELCTPLPDLLRDEGGYAAATCTAYERDFRSLCNYIKQENGSNGHE
jgi:hypothetical protein